MTSLQAFPTCILNASPWADEASEPLGFSEDVRQEKAGTGLLIDVQLFPTFRLRWREMLAYEEVPASAETALVYKWDARLQWLRFLVAPHFVQQCSAECGLETVSPRDEVEVADALAHHLALALLRECKGEFKSGRAFADALGGALVTRLLRDYRATIASKTSSPAAQPLAGGTIRRVRDFTAAHLGEDIGLSDMASIAGLSVFHFARCFHASTGLTPHEFLTQQRIKHAVTLLLGTQEPIIAIAGQCGFSDQSHLNRHLRRQLGITAGQLRPR
jgi:AraC family transcriptional regulator